MAGSTATESTTRDARLASPLEKEAGRPVLLGRADDLGSPDPASLSLAVLQAVADPIRWTVLDRLAAGPACVCAIQEHVPVAGNLLSYHLKVLREAGLVTASRRGRWIDYALSDDAPTRMAAALPGASAS